MSKEIIINTLEDTKKLLFDINSLSPKSNAKLTQLSGLTLTDMQHSGYITQSLLKYDFNNYYSTIPGNIVNNFNENTHKDNLSNEEKNEINKEFYNSTQKNIKIISEQLYKIISTQKNKTINQADLNRLSGTSILNDNCYTLSNLRTLLESKKILKSYNNGRNRMITIGENCEYTPIEIINTNHNFSSKGEAAIAKFLDDHKIEYIWQKIFKECKDKRPLPFDFYFVHNDIEYLIEYQGEQHYKVVEHWGGEDGLKLRQEHDTIKRNFAKEGFELIEIPYTIKTDKQFAGFLSQKLGIKN